MNKSICLLTLIALFACSMAESGTEGHGGDAVVNGSKVSLLDLVESTDQYIVPSREGLTGLGAALDTLCIKLKTIVQDPDQLIWVKVQRPLEPISDTGVISVTVEGEIRQLAVQKDGVVLINGPLYDKMSTEHKRGLILHETLIATALRVGRNLNTTLGTAPLRKIVALISQASANGIPDSVYQSLWNSLPVIPGSEAAYRYNNVESTGDDQYVFVDSPRFKSDGQFVRFGIQLLGKNRESGNLDNQSLMDADEAACDYFGLQSANFSGGSAGADTLANSELVVYIDRFNGTPSLTHAKKGAFVLSSALCWAPQYWLRFP